MLLRHNLLNLKNQNKNKDIILKYMKLKAKIKVLSWINNNLYVTVLKGKKIQEKSIIIIPKLNILAAIIIIQIFIVKRLLIHFLQINLEWDFLQWCQEHMDFIQILIFLIPKTYNPKQVTFKKMKGKTKIFYNLRKISN